ncbi:MAG: hypothetical protein HUU46_13250 [Candidatus Hydrogenedentes bacterium]|nr:hypothetical protein [Candidatus Hydrogenedentota bacterium]
MNVKLDTRFERQLQALAEAQGRTIDEVAQEAIQTGLAKMSGNGDSAEMEVWKPRLLRFLDEISALPVESPADGFSGVEHDDVLYPRSS